MKRLVVLFACFISGLAFTVVPSAIADKPPEPPGQGECNHGNSNQPCKPDPSTNGKDCDPHGNNGGVNEDHCLGTTSTTTPSTSSTTTTRETTSTTTTNETVPSTSSTSSTTTTQNQTTSVLTQTTPVTTSTPTGTSPQTNSVTPDAAPPLRASGITAATKTVVAKGELPNTGLKLILVVIVGVALVVSGLYLRRKKNAA
jgi:LPXTG-motif cell wall-anchored protein